MDKTPVLVFEQRGVDKTTKIIAAIQAHSPSTVDELLNYISQDGKPSKPTLERALRKMRDDGILKPGVLELTPKGTGFTTYDPDEND